MSKISQEEAEESIKTYEEIVEAMNSGDIDHEEGDSDYASR